MTPTRVVLPPSGIRRAWDGASLVLLAGLVLTAVATFADYGVAWDDPGLRTYGRLLLDFYRSGLADLSFTRFADLVYSGGAFELLWAPVEPLVPGDPLVARHLACVAVGIAGIALARAIARRIAGPRAGLLAAPTEFDGIRHHLFLLPPLAVLAAIGLERAWSAATVPRRRALACAVIAVAGLAGARLAATHPYEYVAFNGLAGGPAGAEGRFEPDYWGLSLREVVRRAAEELAREGLADPRRAWQVAVCGEAETIATVLPPFLRLADAIDHADLLIAVNRPSCSEIAAERRIAESRAGGALLGFAAVRSARLAAARQGALAALAREGAPP